ncbi:glycosyltransferase family 2 protein [Helicobacter aurati]|uniref:Glycosyltransferase family 2 protein n=1 Tax=Helicobacter aurati TaxID=137778 RepID=A0A3D8J800_9HELI|nr:glycosyltransferase family 2 protein [Helicobacter aurati]RDU73639.1 glycosyltransferase family 2 protein [Helicobacter aurati]
MKMLFLIPYYNHPAKIIELVETLCAYNLSILLIDDGSNQDSKQVLQTLQADYIESIDSLYPHNNKANKPCNKKQLQIYTRATNGGKGAALKDGFRIAHYLGFTHAFQIDADMQHDLDRITDFLALSKQYPDNLICAYPIYDKSAPKARLYGRRLTNLWVTINTLSYHIKDAMCGYRIYPLLATLALLPICQSNAMDFDIEILVLSAKANIQMRWVGVQVHYATNQVSHFRGLRDNIYISKMHAKHFFLLPIFIIQKITKKLRDSKEQTSKEVIMMQETATNRAPLQWYQRREKAGRFWLNITLKGTLMLPQPVLRFCINSVSLIFFLFLREERKNITSFYNNLQSYAGIPPVSAYHNFRAFAESICDKIAVWKGKITYNDLDIINLSFINEQLTNKTDSLKKSKGQIILTSHFGNVEIARALSNKKDIANINVIMYKKNAMAFMELINTISQNALKILYIEDFTMETMIQLQNIIDNGEHIGIMGDRISLQTARNKQVQFLGKPCYFPQGAFLLAYILQTKISMLWCEKYNGRFRLELQPLNYQSDTYKHLITKNNREEYIDFLLQQYIKALEQKVIANPKEWFNFFDFWENRNEESKK